MHHSDRGVQYSCGAYTDLLKQHAVTISMFAVAFNPDGKWVATGSEDRTARVMEATTGQELYRIDLPGSARQVRFSSDSRWLDVLHSASTGNDLIYARHPLDPQELCREACEKVTRNLTVAEWKQCAGPEIPYRRTCDNLPFPQDYQATR